MDVRSFIREINKFMGNIPQIWEKFSKVRG
jgi:hypothetical protein